MLVNVGGGGGGVLNCECRRGVGWGVCESRRGGWGCNIAHSHRGLVRMWVIVCVCVGGAGHFTDLNFITCSRNP